MACMNTLHIVMAIMGSLLTVDVSNTAALMEKGDGEEFAVDPWLVDAGVPPPVIPLAVWLGEDGPPKLRDASF
jgi:hypothetical protein